MSRHDIAKKCKHEKVVFAVDGEIVCSQCGLVLRKALIGNRKAGVRYPQIGYPSENSTRLHIALMKMEI